MTIGTLDRIEAVRAPGQRKITKREVPRLGDSGILTVRDANRSIADRKAKEKLNKKKADKALGVRLFTAPFWRCIFNA
jgi:hypothetical protein